MGNLAANIMLTEADLDREVIISAIHLNEFDGPAAECNDTREIDG
jgi:hypothetical protein